MARVGHVIEKQGEFAIISTSRRGVCEGCGDKANCSFDPALGGDKPEVVTVRDPIGTRLGDMVEFDLVGRMELKVSMIVWILPLIGLIAGALFGSQVYATISLSRDIGTLFGAIGGFILVFLGVMGYERLYLKKGTLTPVVQKKIASANCDLPLTDLTSDND